MLFAIVIDPFLRKFEATVVAPGLGTVRACADDIGAALCSMHGLIPCHAIFADAKNISSLTLKPTKCVLVPVAESLSEGLVDRIRGWLTEMLPDWNGFSIQGSAKYLGFMMGPSSQTSQWTGVLAKWRQRAFQIACTHSSPLQLYLSFCTIRGRSPCYRTRLSCYRCPRASAVRKKQRCASYYT